MKYECGSCENVHEEDEWHYYTVTYDNPFWDWETDVFDPKKPGVVTLTQAMNELKKPPNKRDSVAGYWFVCPSCEREVWDVDINAVHPHTNAQAAHYLKGGL